MGVVGPADYATIVQARPALFIVGIVDQSTVQINDMGFELRHKHLTC